MLEHESTSDFEDPRFLERIRARDPEAVASVVRAYLGQVVRAARAAGLDAEEAEDVAQTTFLTFIETAPRFEGRSRVRTWIFGILYRKISESRRHRSRRIDGADDIDGVFAERFDDGGSWLRAPRTPDQEAEDSEIRAAIEGCLEDVPPRQRMAFSLREIEGLATPEICKILDVTPTNLGVMLHRVRNRLRECLETKGIAA